jgi:hypothetical protein
LVKNIDSGGRVEKNKPPGSPITGSLTWVSYITSLGLNFPMSAYTMGYQ